MSDRWHDASRAFAVLYGRRAGLREERLDWGGVLGLGVVLLSGAASLSLIRWLVGLVWR